MEDNAPAALKCLMKEKYATLVDDYIRTTRFQLQMIKIKAVARKEQEIKDHAHIIRSSSAMMGFLRLSSLAATLEGLVSVTEIDMQSINGTIEDMRRAFENAVDVLMEDSLDMPRERFRIAH